MAKASKGNTNVLVVVVVLVAALGGLWLWMKKAGTLPKPAGPVTVQLSEQNNSKESGTATLTEVDGKVVVSLSLTGAPKGVTQPGHIHMGACPTPGAVSYPLTSPVDGVSKTTLNVTLAELKQKLPLAINIHKSVSQSQVYVACGDLSL